MATTCGCWTISIGTREQLGSITSFDEIELSELSENSGQVQLLVGDILDKDLTEAVAGSIDTIVHLAANTGVGPSVEDPRNDCMQCDWVAEYAKSPPE